MKAYKFIVCLFVITLVACAKKQNSSYLGCRDLKGNPVDWYNVFLFPDSSASSSNHGRYNYAYIDSNLKDLKYFSEDSSKFPAVIQSLLLNNVNKDKHDTNYFIWNDEAGDLSGNSSSKAHSKGMIGYNKDGGFFMTHSLPKFPAVTKGVVLDQFQDNAGKFGQDFFCVSVDKANAEKAIRSLTIINPSIYLNHGDSDFVNQPANADVMRLIEGGRSRGLPRQDNSEIASLKGTKMNIFSKAKPFKELPWDSAIPSFYQDSFYVETWTRPARLPSSCDKKFGVHNVNTVTFGNYSFNKNQEHSKWAVGVKKDVSCMGDLNRTDSQLRRGGLVICFSSKFLPSLIRKAITAHDCNDRQDEFLKFIE